MNRRKFLQSAAVAVGVVAVTKSAFASEAKNDFVASGNDPTIGLLGRTHPYEVHVIAEYDKVHRLYRTMPIEDHESVTMCNLMALTVHMQGFIRDDTLGGGWTEHTDDRIRHAISGRAVEGLDIQETITRRLFEYPAHHALRKLEVHFRDMRASCPTAHVVDLNRQQRDYLAVELAKAVKDPDYSIMTDFPVEFRHAWSVYQVFPYPGWSIITAAPK